MTSRPSYISSLACAAALSIVVAVLVLSAPAFAQQPEDDRELAQPSEREAALNEEAVRAIIDQDYGKAVALLEESRAMGESNVLYLNLGRAYQGLGRCDKAQEMLARVSSAPVVEEPAPEVVEKKAAEFIAELDANCERDEPAEAVDDDPSSGEAAAAPGQADTPSQAASSGESNIWAWTAIGTGAALGGAALGLELWAGSKRDSIGGEGGQTANVTYAEAQDIESSANTLSTTALGLAVAGSVSAGVGLYLLFSDSEAPPQTSMSVGWTGDAASVGVHTSW
jgi:hypothetical protein